MRNLNQEGSTAVTLDVVFAVLFVIATVFAVWAFVGRQDYKNNSDQKIYKAVAAAKAAQETQLKQQFAEEAKSPNKFYHGSSTYGSVSFAYPKTWSAYVDENGIEHINGYFYPDFVPSLQGSTAFALRAELVNTAYSSVLQQFSTQIKAGKIRASAYVPPKMVGNSNVQAGMRLDGAISSNQTSNLQGSMVLIQVRDKTLELYTQSPDFLNDFNNTVLANLTFVP
jgi:hypothetical protein